MRELRIPFSDQNKTQKQIKDIQNARADYGF